MLYFEYNLLSAGYECKDTSGSVAPAVRNGESMVRAALKQVEYQGIAQS